MKCPNPTHKKKPVDLQTVRTLANHNSVRRERRCPSCDKQYWTVEEFEENINLKTAEARKEYDQLEAKFYEASNQLKGAFNVLQQFKILLTAVE